jgi:hypothetical protein
LVYPNDKPKRLPVIPQGGYAALSQALPHDRTPRVLLDAVRSRILWARKLERLTLSCSSVLYPSETGVLCRVLANFSPVCSSI